MNKRLTFTFALTGRREWGHGTQGVALGWRLVGLSARAGPHNRLLRRQHCSSLCSQSEGHEHVANKYSALGHDSVGFLAVFGRVFKIQKNLCAFFCQTTSGEACAHDKRTKREKERPERAASSQPRATPWVSVYKHLRPVRAKV